MNFVEVFRRGDNFKVVFVVAQVISAGFDGDVEQFLLRLGGLTNHKVALLFKQPAHRSRFAEVAALLGKNVPNLGDRAIAIVRDGFNQ